jgi:hypothetical protein
MGARSMSSPNVRPGSFFPVIQLLSVMFLMIARVVRVGLGGNIPSTLMDVVSTRIQFY